jgi:hypothetical protein
VTTTALFPWRHGDPHRDRAADWVLEAWATHYPGVARLTTGDVDGLDVDGAWCKANHVAHLAALASPEADVLVVSDVDVWVDPAAVRAAVDLVTRGDVTWAVPHRDVYRLNAAATAELIARPVPGGPPAVAAGDLAERPYRGHLGGGVVVLGRRAALDVPLDPRFVGWGQEDDSWAMALVTLAGKPWRGSADLVHLWHPPQPRMNRMYGSAQGQALAARYRRASGHPVAMRGLLAEIRPG